MNVIICPSVCGNSDPEKFAGSGETQSSPQKDHQWDRHSEEACRRHVVQDDHQVAEEF